MRSHDRMPVRKKRSPLLIKSSSLHIEHALAAIDDGVTITDPNLPDNPIIFSNHGFTQMTGYTPAEVVGRNCRFLQGPETNHDAKEVIRKAVRESRSARVVLVNYKKDGTPFHNELTVSPVRDNSEPGGRVLYYVGIQKDITQLLRMEEASATAERNAAELTSRLASIVEIMSVGFVTLDGRSRVIYMNPHGETILGKSSAEIVGNNLWDVFQQPVGSIFWQQYNFARQKRTEVTFEAIYEPLDIWLDVRIVPSKDGISVFFRDVTERYRLQEERQKLRAEKEMVLQQLARDERKMFQNVIFSVTEGKLRLCDSVQELPPLLPSISDLNPPIALNGLQTLGQVRQQVRQACDLCDFSQERMYDLMIAAGECAMNALQHGIGENGEATAQISIDKEHGLVQVRVTDQGKGISLSELPRRTLLHRHSGAGTPGHGLYMMLSTCDRIWMLTGSQGTTIVLEQERIEPDPLSVIAANMPVRSESESGIAS